jgi:very-short-patch-repair endonuclease
MQNVAARRVDRITSSEEERQRQGYDVLTGIRFADHGHGPVCRVGTVTDDGQPLLLLTHGDAATIRRVNLGLKRRSKNTGPGFVLDLEKGLWGRESDEESDDQDPVGPRTMRVIPFVEDRKNCLVVNLPDDPAPEFRASLRAALKAAIQVEFQLEDMELAAEAIPDRSRERRMLFYEATEGGAGVLRRLLDEPDALTRVARKALELCHFDPETGADKRRAPHGKEDCEAACYDCLRSYGNQPEHALLDRQLLRDFLLRLARAKVAASPAPVARNEHLEALLGKCDSQLEKSFLQFLEKHLLRLPSHAQSKVESVGARPDFLYKQEQVAVYVDGPVHDFPERQKRDAAQQAALEDLGITVIRFHHEGGWPEVVRRFPDVFGKLPSTVS